MSKNGEGHWIDNRILGMGGNGNDGNLFPSGTIVLENSISSGRPLLDIDFKNFLPPWPLKRGKFVGVQGRRPQVRFHESERLSYRL